MSSPYCRAASNACPVQPTECSSARRDGSRRSDAPMPSASASAIAVTHVASACPGGWPVPKSVATDSAHSSSTSRTSTTPTARTLVPCRDNDWVLSAVVAVLLLMAGAALLTAGAEAFAENVAPASARLGVSMLALGVLLAGAEPEEAITAALASGQGHPALAVGDAIGANLVILTLTLGLAALVTKLPVTRRSREYGVAAAVLGVVAWLLLLNGVLGRFEGALLVLLYAA